jgi:hypothetical protein
VHGGKSLNLYSLLNVLRCVQDALFTHIISHSKHLMRSTHLMYSTISRVGKMGQGRFRDTLSKGDIVQGTHCPWDTLSKGRIVQGTHCPRDTFSTGDIVQGSYCPRDALSKRHIVHTLSKGHIVQGTHRPRKNVRDTSVGDTSAGTPRSGTHRHGITNHGVFFVAGM